MKVIGVSDPFTSLRKRACCFGAIAAWSTVASRRIPQSPPPSPGYFPGDRQSAWPSLGEGLSRPAMQEEEGSELNDEPHRPDDYAEGVPDGVPVRRHDRPCGDKHPGCDGQLLHRSHEFRLGDVSEDRVTPSPASVPTAEAGEYRSRGCAAKPPEQRQRKGDQQPRRCRATWDHDLSEPSSCLQSQYHSTQRSANGAEKTSQSAASLHACGLNSYSAGTC